MIVAVISLVIGFICLVKGADWFVDGSSAIAKRFGIPSLIIGLTIVAFGTSAPEAAVSITASLSGQNEIAVGNILGSNIFNLLFILGICAIMKPLKVHRSIINRDFPLSILAALVVCLCGLDVFFGEATANFVTRVEGLIILCFFGIFLYATARSAINDDSEQCDKSTILPLSKSLIYLAIGLVAIIIGGKLVVSGASEIATALGLGKDLIALTIVAIGTSLPELVTSFVATRKGEADIAIGNVIGSNIFNIFFILGFSALLSPLAMTASSMFDVAFLVVSSLIVFIFAFKQTITKKHGIIMLLMYAVYTAYIIIR